MKEEYFNAHLPADELGFSKYIAAKHIEQSEKIVELRIFGVFGKYEDYTIRFISNMICKAIFDLPLTMRQNRKFDYIYIDDFIRVLDYFINNDGNYKAYNITPDQSIELYAIAKRVLSISEKKMPIEVAREGIGVEYSGDNSRLRGEIKNLQFTLIDQAIQQLYAWYYHNRQQINKEWLLIDK
jgi:GDP-L-fucose synthase